MPRTYPIELNLIGRPVLVVGGGTVADRKVRGLLEAGAAVRVVSPEFAPELDALPGLDRRAEPYRPELLDGARLVFACTDDHPLNARIAADARARGIWCNVADAPDACDFFLPATLRRGQFTLAVSTGGAAPHLAARLRDALASQFGPSYAILMEELDRARTVVQDRVADPQVRRRILETLGTDGSVRLLGTRGPQAWRDWFERVLEAGLQDHTAPEPN